MRLYVIRHAQVAIEPDVPAEGWHLSAAGWESARGLAGRLSHAGIGVLHHSPQPKARETALALAEVLGLPLRLEPGLGELAMEIPWLGAPEFERRVGDFLEGGADPAFEPYDLAQRRIVECVRAIVARCAEPATAVVSHGRILTVLFSALCGVRLGAEEWRALRTPDLAVVDLARGVVQEGFWAGRPVTWAPGAPA